MIDQRGQRRQVVCDGQRQAQGTAQDERGHLNEQRGIRLLADDGSGRTALRSGPAIGRPDPSAIIDAEPASRPEPAAASELNADAATEQAPAARPRRFRADETHTVRTSEANGGGGRAPGPLRARIALRHSRETAG
jgi:hypothetical protein